MSVRIIMNGLFNCWFEYCRASLQPDEGQEEPDDSRARELARSVTSSCGSRIVTCLSDGGWHSVVRFLCISHRIQDSDITDMFPLVHSDWFIDSWKIEIMVTGLECLVGDVGMCESQPPAWEGQNPDLSNMVGSVLDDVMGFNTGDFHNEYRIRPDVLPNIDSNDLRQWTAPGQETPPQTHDQGLPSTHERQPRRIILGRHRPKNDA